MMPNTETNNYTLERAPDYITLNLQGQIVHESIFDKNFDGDLDLLLDCAEDNIYGDGSGEWINWEAVFDDYQTALKAKEKTDAED